MGWIGFKKWAYDFLWPRYPKGYTPGRLADLAIANGIESKSRDPWHSLQSTSRRWTRPGDAYQDARFGQKYEDGELVIFAYSPNGVNSRHSVSDTNESEGDDGLNVDNLVDLLVQHGEYAHRLDALRALGNLTLSGEAVPQALLKDLEAVLSQEREVYERKKELISQLRSLLDSGH